MKSFKSVILIGVLFLSGVLFSSCNKRVEAEGPGYVQLTLGNPEVDILTKAEPQVVDDSYNVVITKDQVEAKNATYGELKNQFAILPGTYDIYAQNMTAEAALTSREGRGEQRFYGESSFEIQAGIVTNVSFTCEMANARVSVGLDDSFRQVFSNAEITIYESSDESRKLVFPYSTTIDDSSLWGYFNIDSDPELIVNVAVTRNDGHQNNFTVKTTLEAKTWHKLTIKSNSTNGEADLEIYVNDALVEQDEEWGVDPY